MQADGGRRKTLDSRKAAREESLVRRRDAEGLAGRPHRGRYLFARVSVFYCVVFFLFLCSLFFLHSPLFFSLFFFCFQLVCCRSHIIAAWRIYQPVSEQRFTAPTSLDETDSDLPCSAPDNAGHSRLDRYSWNSRPEKKKKNRK